MAVINYVINLYFLVVDSFNIIKIVRSDCRLNYLRGVYFEPFIYFFVVAVICVVVTC